MLGSLCLGRREWMESGQREQQEQRLEGRKLQGVLRTHWWVFLPVSPSRPGKVALLIALPSDSVFPLPHPSLSSIRHCCRVSAYSTVLRFSVDFFSSSFRIFCSWPGTRFHSSPYPLNGMVPGTQLVLKESKDHKRQQGSLSCIHSVGSGKPSNVLPVS